MKLCSLKDFNEVYTFFTREDIAGDITDDFEPGIFVAVKQMLSCGLVLMPTNNTVFVFSPVNSILYSAHLNTTVMDKDRLYSNTLQAAQWLKKNTPVQTLISYIPTISRATLHYSQKIGMKEIGRVPHGFMKNGQLVGNIIMSSSVDNIIKEISKWQQ